MRHSTRCDYDTRIQDPQDVVPDLSNRAHEIVDLGIDADNLLTRQMSVQRAEGRVLVAMYQQR